MAEPELEAGSQEKVHWSWHIPVTANERAYIWKHCRRLSDKHPKFTQGESHGCTLTHKDGNICTQTWSLKQTDTKRPKLFSRLPNAQ